MNTEAKIIRAYNGIKFSLIFLKASTIRFEFESNLSNVTHARLYLFLKKV